MFIVFLSPFLRADVPLFLEAAFEVARVGLITQKSEAELPEHIRKRLAGFWQVQNLMDVDELHWAARGLTEMGGKIERVLTENEHIQLPVSELRARLDLPGMWPDTILNFRDKSRMKERLRAWGLPCARFACVTDPEQAFEFVSRVGYPIIVKPVDGAATQSTYRVESDDDLHHVLLASEPSWSHPLQVEEFVTGEEHSFETISLNGRALWHSITRYYPTPLDVMRNPWIQWRIVTPREIDDARYDDIREVGVRALDALGMETGISHLEWFRRKDGSIAIGEVAARPPGSQIFTALNWANDFDMYRGWVRLMLRGEFTPPAERKYAVGTAFLRGLGRGQVRQVRGLDYVLRQLEGMVVEVKTPQPGQPSGVTYEGEGYVMVRHPETAVVEAALQTIISNVRVELSV